MDINWNERYVFRGFHIPEYMMDALQRYVEKGVIPGGFLTAVISNDLRGAVNHADEENLINIPAYIGFFYNECPAGCWGSREIMEQWSERGGLNGLVRATA